MWCCNAGHGAADFGGDRQTGRGAGITPAFQFGIPGFELRQPASPTSRLPGSITFSFAIPDRSRRYALKIALAYQQIQGQGTRSRLIGRERGYHGVGFGGTGSAASSKRKMFGTLLAGVDHLPTPTTEKQASARASRNTAHFADELEAWSTCTAPPPFAAVIVERWQDDRRACRRRGLSQGLREITQKHGILLIFDEVITVYGRLGFPSAELSGVLPDMLTFAKGITNGAAPDGRVLVRDTIHDLHDGQHVVELTHGYTYSRIPCCGRGACDTDIYPREKLFARAGEARAKFADAVMSLKGEPNVDIRRWVLTAGITSAAPGLPGKRGFDGLNSAFHDNDLMLRVAAYAGTDAPLSSRRPDGEIIERSQGDPAVA